MKFTFTCGHIEDIRVTGKDHMLEMKEYAASNKCSTCVKIDLAAAPRKEQLTLPKLTGTEKQVAWAEQIREKVIQQREAVLEKMQSVRLTSILLEGKTYLAGYIAHQLDRFIETETSAADWIDIFKPLTSQYSKHPDWVNVIGGMIQRSGLFGLDMDDINFLHFVAKEGSK